MFDEYYRDVCFMVITNIDSPIFIVIKNWLPP